MKSVIALLLVSLCCQVSLGWEEDYRVFITDLHNEVRRRPGACQMNKLEYDLDLEKQAQAWLDRCVYAHESLQGRGENLAWNTAHDSQEDMMNLAMKMWYDEVNLYTYGQHSCSQSCHYTQLVWSTVTKVGCATRRCDNLVNAAKDSWFFGCFYTPGGNFNGEVPYKKTCDKPCLEGQTEEDGLCVGEPTGEDATDKCEDTVDRCAGWAAKGQCEKNAGYMEKKCPVSCGICEGQAFEAPADLPACHDEGKSCEGWAKRGMCRRNPGYMNNHCKKSCGKCH